MSPRKKLDGWGSRIYEARAAMRSKTGRKMSQDRLGELVGVSGSQIGFYESETNEPEWAMWVKMAKALLIDDPGELAFGTVETRRMKAGADSAEGTG